MGKTWAGFQREPGFPSIKADGARSRGKQEGPRGIVLLVGKDAALKATGQHPLTRFPW